MKKYKHTNMCAKPLVDFVSKDPTRVSLAGFSYQNGYMVSSDGSRIFATKPFNNLTGLVDGKIYSPLVFRDTGQLVEDLPGSGIKFPDLAHVFHLVNKADKTCTFRIPKWFSSIKSKNIVPMTLDLNSKRISLGGTTGDNQVCFDARLLVPLSDFDEVTVFFGGRRDGFVICPYGSTFENKMSGDWLAVIMPLNFEGETLVKTAEVTL